jgi:hypothetical protein
MSQHIPPKPEISSHNQTINNCLQESNVGSDELSDELDEENNYSSDLAQRLVGNAQGWMLGMGGVAMGRLLRMTNGTRPSIYLHS